MQLKQHQQLVRQRMELQSKRIGTVAMAGKSIAAKAALVGFNLVFALSPLIVEVIDLFSSTGSIGNDKPNIGPQRTDFNLNQDSSSFVPAFGPVAKTIEESNGSFCAGILALGLFDPALGSFLEDGVGRNADRVKGSERFQDPIDFWSSRAGIGPIADLSFREALLKDGNQAIELSGDSR